MIGALFAAATAAGIPQYSRSLEIVSMRSAIEDVGPINSSIHVTTSWTPLMDEDRQHADEAVFSAADRYLGELILSSTRLTKSRLHWWGRLEQGIRTDSLASQATFQFMENIDDHVEYLAGEAPTDNVIVIDGESVIEVAVFHDRARHLRIEIGDVIDSQAVDRGSGLIRAVVTGTFEQIEPGDDYWMEFGDAFLAPAVEGREQPLVMFPTNHSMFTAVAEADAGLPATYDWFLHTDQVLMADTKVGDLESALDDLTISLEDSLTRPFVITEMIPRIESMKRRALFGSIPLLLMALLVLACVVFYLTMAAGLMGRRRISGYVMLRSRGFNVRQQLRIHVLEAGLVSIPAAAVGPLISYLIIGSLGYLPGYEAITGGSRMPVELGISAWLWAFGAAVGTTVVITAASSFWDRSTVAEVRSSDARPVNAPWFQRYYVDALLVALSGILWWELGARNGVIVAEREGDFSPDISLLAAPILIVVAGSLVALRLFPVMTRIAERIGTRTGSTAITLGLSSVARRPFFHGWPMLAFALAISTGIVAGSVVSTLERSTNEQVLYSTGSDIHVVTTGSTGQVDRERLENVRNLESIDVATDALRMRATVGTTSGGSTFTFFGVDPIDFQRVAWFRDDFSDSETSFTQLVDRLAVRVMPEPIELPAGTNEVGLWAKSDPFIPNHQLWLVVRDGLGDSHTINLGNVGADWEYKSALFPNYPDPIEIMSIQTNLKVGPDSAPPTELFIDDLIATSGTGGADGNGTQHIVLDFDLPELWTGLPTAQADDTSFKVTAEPPEVSGIVDGDSGAGVASITLGRGSNQGVRGVYRSAIDRPIPMLANNDFMVQSSVGIRRPFIIEVDGGLIPVEVIESINYFPTLDPARGPFAIADIDAITEFFELRGRRKLVPNELFASTLDTELSADEIAESVRDVFRLARIDSRATRINDAFVDPVAVAGWRGMSVVATIVAAATALMAYTIFLAAYSLRTRGDSALILALGASRRDYWISMLAELSPAIIVGSLVGLGTGLAVSSLMVGSMAHTGTGERLLPPFLLQTNWIFPLVTIASILTIVIAGVTNSVRSFSGIQIADIAREGFSAAST